MLFGQPELDKRLAAAAMRQLKERITHNFALEPLRRGDVGDYLMFRVRAAGYRGQALFTPGATQLVSRASEGLTRRINILADKALMSAFSEMKHVVDKKQVRAAIRDAQFNPMRDRPSRATLWAGGVALIASIVAAAYFAGSRTKPLEAPASAKTEAPAAPVAKAATVAIAAPDDLAAPATPEITIAGTTPTLAERLAATDEWLKTAADAHYFLQLVSTDAANQRDVENFLAQRTSALDPQQVRVYRSKLSGRERIGVIYGDFASLDEARAALAKLSRNHPGNGAYIRTFSKLK